MKDINILGKKVDVIVDRPLGSYHPKYKNLYKIEGIFMKKYILITDIIGLVGSLIIFILSIISEYDLWAIVILGIICLIWIFKLIYY